MLALKTPPARGPPHFLFLFAFFTSVPCGRRERISVHSSPGLLLLFLLSTQMLSPQDPEMSDHSQEVTVRRRHSPSFPKDASPQPRHPELLNPWQPFPSHCSHAQPHCLPCGLGGTMLSHFHCSFCFDSCPQSGFSRS